MDKYQGLRCYQVGQTFEEVGVREKKIQCDDMIDFVSLYHSIVKKKKKNCVPSTTKLACAR